MSNIHHLKADFLGGMAFETELNGHKLIIDVDKESGGEDLGMRPKALMLASLMGCTGMDVAALMKKMQVDCKKFEMDVQAPLSEEHPKVYTSIELIYRFEVSEEDKPKCEKAVKLSQEKYCGVSAMLAKVCPLEYRIEWL